MAKTPFEIRSDLLHLASNALEQEHATEMEEWRRHFDIVQCNCNLNINSVEDAVNLVKELKEKMPKIPSPATSAKVIKRAEELYEFVTKRE